MGMDSESESAVGVLLLLESSRLLYLYCPRGCKARQAKQGHGGKAWMNDAGG